MNGGWTVRKAWGVVCAAVPLVLLGAWLTGYAWTLDTGLRRFDDATSAQPPARSESAWRGWRPFADPDSYCWLTYAREMRETGAWRIRHSSVGNAPAGREMHWSQPLIWGMAGLSWVFERLGYEGHVALELGGMAFMTLFAFVFFGGLYLLLRPRLGTFGAGVLALLVPIWRVWDFGSIRPDHQCFQVAMALLFGMAVLLGDLGGAGRAGAGEAGARRRLRMFTLAGVAAGIGMWTGATVFFFVFAAMLAGCVPALWDARAEAAGADDAGRCWRRAGRVGAAVALAAYVVEYAPHFPWTRLEVVHPLYAASFWATCELMAMFVEWRTAGADWTPRRCGAAAAWAVVAAALPTLVLLGPTAWYWPREGVMWRLHAKHIQEFLTLKQFCASTGQPMLRVLGEFIFIPTALAVLAAVPAVRRSIDDHARRLLAFALTVAAIFTALYVWQVRWSGYGITGVLLMLAAVLLAAREGTVAGGATAEGGSRKARRAAAGASALAPATAKKVLSGAACALALVAIGLNVAQAVETMGRLWRTEKVDPSLFLAMQVRDVMCEWRQRLPEGQSLRVLSPSAYAPALTYYGVGDGLAGLYWENLEGMTDAAAIFADTAPFDEAKRLLRKHGITHILMNEGAQDALAFDDMHTGIYDMNHAAKTFGGALTGQLENNPPPDFVRYLPVENALCNPTLYTFVPLIGQYVPNRLPVRIYEVVGL